MDKEFIVWKFAIIKLELFGNILLSFNINNPEYYEPVIYKIKLSFIVCNSSIIQKIESSFTNCNLSIYQRVESSFTKYKIKLFSTKYRLKLSSTKSTIFVSIILPVINNNNDNKFYSNVLKKANRYLSNQWLLLISI